MKYERGFFVEEVHSPVFMGDVIEYFRSGCDAAWHRGENWA